MLIMWRRAGESFIVGDGVEIEILDAKANRVKLGIVAPEWVPIVRKEARLTRDENVAAALSAGRGMIETLLRHVPGPAPR
jgi:carbon storage regulator